MVGTVSTYAGQQLVTGQQAQVYANNFIAVHLKEIGGGQTYAQLSAKAMALPPGSPAYTAAEQKVQTVFQGTTLRGLLLEAYGFSVLASIALYGAIASFLLAGLMALLVGFGIWHARRTSDAEEFLTHKVTRTVSHGHARSCLSHDPIEGRRCPARGNAEPGSGAFLASSRHRAVVQRPSARCTYAPR